MNSTKIPQDPVQTLSELISVLDEEERANYTTILKSLNLPITEFEKYATWSNTCYTRNCIVENENFELILICWENEQSTPVHDHGGEECWVRFLKGEFKENIYKENDEGQLDIVKTTRTQSGDISYMVDFMGYHNLENLSNKRSMSLHLYAKPIKDCNVYDVKRNKFVRKELSYDTLEGIQQTKKKKQKKVYV